MALPLIQTTDQDLSLMQQRWSSELNPVLANLLIQGAVLPNISLVANVPNTFPHYLGKQMTGWMLIDNTAFCEIKRTQPLNSKTVTLSSNANTTISLWVF